MQATNQVFQRAIEDCKECHLICVQTMQYSIQQGGPYVAPDYLRLLVDCAQTCQHGAETGRRGSSRSEIHGGRRQVRSRVGSHGEDFTARSGQAASSRN